MSTPSQSIKENSGGAREGGYRVIGAMGLLRACRVHNGMLLLHIQEKEWKASTESLREVLLQNLSPAAIIESYQEDLHPLLLKMGDILEHGS